MAVEMLSRGHAGRMRRRGLPLIAAMLLDLVSCTPAIAPLEPPPTFTMGADQVVWHGAGSQSVTSWATGISAGRAGQTVTFSVTSSGSALFRVQPAISPDGTLTFTPDTSAEEFYGVAVIDLASATMSGAIPLGGQLRGIAFTPDGRKAYVVDYGGSVSEIDVATGTETSTHSVGIAPAGVAFTPDGRTAYVTDTADGYVSVVDVASGTVTDTIYGVGRFLQEIAIR